MRSGFASFITTPMPSMTELVGVPDDRIMLLAMLADADGLGQRQRMACARIFLGRRDYPDIVADCPRDSFQHL